MKNGELKAGDYVKIINRDDYDLTIIYEIEHKCKNNSNGDEVFRLKDFQKFEKSSILGEFWCGFLNKVNIHKNLDKTINYKFLND